MIDRIRQETTQVMRELLLAAQMEPGQILVVGCSSSEVAAEKIGTCSSQEIGEVIFQQLYLEAKQAGIFLAAQCCEHLNRALILEGEAAGLYDYEPVNVLPQLKAGGSFATAAYKGLNSPVAVEAIRAHAGIDIGDTLIGMHLRPVAVPVRTQTKQIGQAHVVCARTRLKYIGGQRACYQDEGKG